MNNLLSIVWDVGPEIIALGPLKLRWYGLLFGTAYICGYYFMTYIYKKEGHSVKEVDNIFIYTAVGGIVGARLGHILFYDLKMYLENPIEMLYIWHGGLASHGGVLGIIIMMYIYSRKKRYESFIWYLDRIVVPVGLGGMCIRLGNFFNSEIIGTPTDLPWGVEFVRNPYFSQVPRHPAQLYEALGYLIIFFILWGYYKAQFGRIRKGSIVGLFFILTFGLRFFVEFVKEDQVAFENGMMLNMGQWLSIPLVGIGLWMFLRNRKKPVNSPPLH